MILLLRSAGIVSAGQNCDLAAINPACKGHSDFSKDADGDVVCKEPCARALLACIEGKDGAALKQGFCHAASSCEAWEAVRNLADMCLMDDGAAPDGKPGDGVCNLESLKYTDDPPLDNDGQPNCTSSGVLEMIDCIDNPMLADQHSLIKDLKELCALEKVGIDCEGMFDSMIKAMSPAMDPPMGSDSPSTPAGVCCQGGVECAGNIAGHSSEYPTQCTLGCAKQWVVLWRNCDQTMMDQITDPREQTAVSDWNKMCETTYHGGH